MRVLTVTLTRLAKRKKNLKKGPCYHSILRDFKGQYYPSQIETGLSEYLWLPGTRDGRN